MSAAEPADLDDAIDALYTLPLEGFIAGRDDVVRQAADGGDRLGAERVKRLPKPSVAAWVINQVVREHAADVAAIAAVGDELRAATEDRDRGRIRALDHLRRERIEALVRAVREAGEVGGRTVSAAVLDRLTETLTAAVMDADAAVAVRAGRLSRALQHSGFGVVDEHGEEADLVPLRPADADVGQPDADTKRRDADVGRADGGAAQRDAGSAEAEEQGAGAAEPGAGVGPRGRTKAGDKTRGRKAKAEDTARGREADLEAAERAVDETSAEVDRLEARRDDARERLHAAEAAVEHGESEVDRLDRELERLTMERDAARRTIGKARKEADKARSGLAAVEGELDDAEERAAQARRRRREARGR